jgi:hypothetical protein
VLAGARFGNDPRLAHPSSQQDLAHAVVRLVAARMVQFVAFEIHLRAAQEVGQPLRQPQRAGAPDIMRHVLLQIGLERGVVPRRVVRALDLQDQRHQGLGDEAAAIVAEAATIGGA